MKEIKTTLATILVCLVVGGLLTFALFHTTEYQLEIFASLSFTIVLTVLLLLKVIADVVSYEEKPEYLTNRFKRK